MPKWLPAIILDLRTALPPSTGKSRGVLARTRAFVGSVPGTGPRRPTVAIVEAGGGARIPPLPQFALQIVCDRHRWWAIPTSGIHF